MAVSQNGYPANDRRLVTGYQIGGKAKVMLRRGSTGTLLKHFADWFDASIRDIDPGIPDDWGYAERPIRGGVELSNHASGTALDVDATKWPLGVQPEAYLIPAEIKAVRRQLTVYEGCIRWGGDYIGRKDPMHFEIDRDEATCDRVLAKLTAGPPAVEEEDDVALIIRNSSNGSCHLLVGDRNVPIGQSADLTALAAAGVKLANVTPDFFNTVLAATQSEK